MNPNDVNSPVSLTIRILLYADDFQVANPLGSKTKNSKMTGFYFKIMNLKPTGKLHNIFAYAFARAEDVKDFGYDKIFIPFVNEMETLINEEPIVVTLHGREVTLNFKLVGLTGDSLALNEIYKIRTGRAFRFCRICLISRPEFEANVAKLAHNRSDEHFQILKTIFERKRSSQRSNKADLKKFLKNYGYTSLEDINLSKLRFSPRNNCILGRLHDFLEGVSHIIFIQVVRFLVEKDICSIEFINRRIKSFDFGKIHDSEKPSPNLTQALVSNLKVKKLKQNGTQMHCLIRALPFLILDKLDQFLVNSSNEEERQKIENIIKIISLHLNALQICSSHSFIEANLVTLDEIIVKHNTLYQKTFGLPLINKFHHLSHYSQVIREYGPALYLETTRFEALHKLFKQRMYICRSFIYVPFILARHYAFWSSYNLSYFDDKPILNKNSCEETFDSS